MAEELGYKYADILAQVVGRTACTLDQGVSKVLTSSRTRMSWAVPNVFWRCAAKDDKEGPSQWHYLVGADALYAEYLYLAIFCGYLHPSCARGC